jgi:hypothetical protein
MLCLYGRILRNHRAKLSSQKRSLADSYVKKEFRDHVSAKPDFVQSFSFEWTKYCEHLEGARNEVGKDMSSQEVESLSLEQKTMIARLKQETLAKNLK